MDIKNKKNYKTLASLLIVAGVFALLSYGMGGKYFKSMPIFDSTSIPKDEIVEGKYASADPGIIYFNKDAIPSNFSLKIRNNATLPVRVTFSTKSNNILIPTFATLSSTGSGGTFSTPDTMPPLPIENNIIYSGSKSYSFVILNRYLAEDISNITANIEILNDLGTSYSGAIITTGTKVYNIGDRYYGVGGSHNLDLKLIKYELSIPAKDYEARGTAGWINSTCCVILPGIDTEANILGYKFFVTSDTPAGTKRIYLSSPSSIYLKDYTGVDVTYKAIENQVMTKSGPITVRNIQSISYAPDAIKEYNTRGSSEWIEKTNNLVDGQDKEVQSQLGYKYAANTSEGSRVYLVANSGFDLSRFEGVNVTYKAIERQIPFGQWLLKVRIVQNISYAPDAVAEYNSRGNSEWIHPISANNSDPASKYAASIGYKYFTVGLGGSFNSTSYYLASTSSVNLARFEGVNIVYKAVQRELHVPNIGRVFVRDVLSISYATDTLLEYKVTSSSEYIEKLPTQLDSGAKFAYERGYRHYSNGTGPSLNTTAYYLSASPGIDLTKYERMNVIYYAVQRELESSAFGRVYVRDIQRISSSTLPPLPASSCGTFSGGVALGGLNPRSPNLCIEPATSTGFYERTQSGRIIGYYWNCELGQSKEQCKANVIQTGGTLTTYKVTLNKLTDTYLALLYKNEDQVALKRFLDSQRLMYTSSIAQGGANSSYFIRSSQNISSFIDLSKLQLNTNYEVRGTFTKVKFSSTLSLPVFEITEIVTPRSANCTDTDGGKNYTRKGVLTLNGTVKTDGCRTSTNVNEYFCPNYVGEIAWEAHECDAGSVCSDGACVRTLPPVSNYCSTVLNGVTYSLSPCGISTSMVKGMGDKPFKFTLKQSVKKPYGFGVYGYGEGFPTYGILGGASSGGAEGDIIIEKHFSDSHLEIGSYSGYLKIGVYEGSWTKAGEKELRFPISLKVTNMISQCPVFPSLQCQAGYIYVDGGKDPKTGCKLPGKCEKIVAGQCNTVLTNKTYNPTTIFPPAGIPLCLAGTPSTVTSSSLDWTWTCKGNDGVVVSCKTNKQRCINYFFGRYCY